MHPLRTDVTVIVAVTATVVPLTAVKDGWVPEPLAARPIAGLEFVHVKVAPLGELLNVAEGTIAPGHTTTLVGTVATGSGLTVNTAALDVTVPQPLVNTTSYDAASELTVETIVNVAALAPLITKPFFRH